MLLKDYYKILEVPPNAGKTDIKKAYRKLAQKYHPDKNAESIFAAASFQEIHEAYLVLYNDNKREEYNYQRWNFANSRQKFTQKALTPQAVYFQCQELAKRVAQMDVFRMNQEAVYYQVKQLLPAETIKLLLEWDNEPINQQIIHEILNLSKPLRYQYIEPISLILVSIAGSDNKTISQIHEFSRQRKWLSYWDKYKFALVLAATALLCWLIYRAAN